MVKRWCVAFQLQLIESMVHKRWHNIPAGGTITINTSWFVLYMFEDEMCWYSIGLTLTVLQVSTKC